MCICSWPEKIVNWTWTSLTNLDSGQIQVAIALFALWLAKKGYDKLILQIDMAKDQFKESEEQTKHFADQVKEVAKQTAIAAKHFENSNVQIQELIEHRNLVLEIRKSELESDCIDLSIKAIASIQDTEEVLRKGIHLINGRFDIFIINDPVIKEWLNTNLEKMQKELNDFKARMTVLINLSGNLATKQGDRKKEELERELMTIKMIYLRSLRSKYIYQEFINELNIKVPIRI